jgi:hypothetical protein
MTILEFVGKGLNDLTKFIMMTMKGEDDLLIFRYVSNDIADITTLQTVNTLPGEFS